MSLADDIEVVFGVRQQLWENGYRPVPIYTQSKRPCGVEWNALAKLDPPEAAAVQPRPDALGTGVLGGEISGIDIDVLDQGLSDTIRKHAEDLFEPTPLVRVGQPPKVLLVYRAETPFAKIATPELLLPCGIKCQVEMLGEGQQFVVDGIHPDTQQPYRWIGGYTPYQVPVSSLPVITEEHARAFIADAERILRDAGAKPKKEGATSRPEPPSPESSDTFFNRVNRAALNDVAPWFRRLFPRARFEPGAGAWRISSKDLGRNLEEDISAHSSGIRDFGEEEPCSAIDLVMRHGGASTAVEAALWLCQQLQVDPTSLGYTSDARNHTRKDGQEKHNNKSGGAKCESGDVKLKSGEKYQMQKVTWIMRGWMARGKFHLLGGQKGAGKSTIGFDLLAQITSGGKFPDGTTAPVGDVLIWSGEDDIEDTILPRISVAGGNLNRVWFVEGVIVDGVKRAFDPAVDVAGLIIAARQLPDLLAVLIDPIVSATTGDSHKNSETRRGLQPLVDFAVDRNIALIGITHFTKGTQGQDPIERITGSLAYGAIPRVVWAAAKGDNEDGPRKFIRIGSNIGMSGGGFEYLLRQDLVIDHDFTAQRILWGKRLDGSPLELLEGVQERSAKMQAMKLLDDQLINGPVRVEDIKAAAQAHGVSWRTVERAKLDAKDISADQAATLRKQGLLPAGDKSIGWYWRRVRQAPRHTASQMSDC